jgi:poly-beta-1,6-N-acetyl-D-glucosamine N-deacetylase
MLGMALLAVSLPARAADHAVVFIYHRFGEPRYPSTNTPVAAFRAQLDYLATHGFHVWSLPHLVRTLQAGGPVPDRTVALTIDDAFQSVYDKAWPLLRAHHFPVTVFVSTQVVDRRYPAYMSWQEMRTMKAQGATFAAHSVTHPHPLLRRKGESRAAWLERMRVEVLDGQQRLQQELGPDTNTDPKLFAYPYGEYDASLARLVTRLGFVAFAQVSGALGEPLDGRALPRFPVDTRFDALGLFARRAVSLPMPLGDVFPWSPVVKAASNPPRLTLSLARPLHGLACYRSDGTRMALARASATRIIVQARAPLPRGRSMYTCTAPARGGTYYWYTHPWFRMP